MLKTDAQINWNIWSDVTSFVTIVAAFSVQKIFNLILTYPIDSFLCFF